MIVLPHVKTRLRIPLIALSVIAVLGVIGCGSSSGLERPEPTIGSELSAGSSTGSSIGETPTSAPEAPLTAQEEEAIDIMWEMFSGYGSISENAVRAAGRNGHAGLIPVLVEAASRTFEPDLALVIAEALQEITGESVGGDFVLAGPWFSWMSRQDPPQVLLQGFDEWKGELLGTIDPSFKTFIYKDVPSRIPLWTVEWGGVVRDGIPPLEFPNNLPGDEVIFLNPDEPVFGVTVNGESRAYPHRIMGWHELANDRLGGELISFIF